MTCRNCGAEIGDNRRFCGKCGTEVIATPSPTAPAPTGPPPTAPPSTWGAPSTSPPPPPPPPPPAAERDPFAAPDLYAPPAYGAAPPPGYPPPPYGYPPPQGYPPGAWPGYGPAPSNNGFAIASLVLGLLGWFPCGVGSVLAIVFGFVARGQIKQSQGRQTGSGMATAGIILGFVAVAFWLLIFIVALADAGSNP
jgi:Domain of unknown function (DUF4190)/zinc-ribbon domain